MRSLHEAEITALSATPTSALAPQDGGLRAAAQAVVSAWRAVP